MALGAAILASELLGRRLRLAPPVLLLASGVALGFIPALRGVSLPPQAVLLLFLPALLYWETLTTSLRDVRRDLRGIILLSTLLVIATAGAVAATVHALGLPWGPAWVLGGALAPTDATAAGALARVLPPRAVTLLRAESLVNDGTALVIYGLAVGITVGEEHFTFLHVSWLFLRAYVGGAAAGAAVAWLITQVRHRVTDPLLGNVGMVMVPFAAYLIAESIGASGVLAVVVCGLIMSQVGPRIGSADARMQAAGFWSLATFLLNGALFVLVGLQAQSSVRDLTSFDLARALIAVLVVCAVLIVVRFAFQMTAVYLIRALDRRPQQRARRVSHRFRVVSALAGFRGAVSLAAALAVPETLHSGAPFPGRDVIVFVTFGVIVVTLVAQVLALPGVVRRTHLPQQDPTGERERHLAEVLATEEAIAAMPRVAAELGTDPEVLDRMRREYDRRLRLMQAHGEESEDEAAVRYDRHYTALRRALLARKRATVIRLRDERRIDDGVLREIQARLDIEEVRLSGVNGS